MLRYAIYGFFGMLTDVRPMCGCAGILLPFRYKVIVGFALLFSSCVYHAQSYCGVDGVPISVAKVCSVLIKQLAWNVVV